MNTLAPIAVAIQALVTIALVIVAGWFLLTLRKIAEAARVQANAASEQLELARVHFVRAVNSQHDVTSRTVQAFESVAAKPSSPHQNGQHDYSPGIIEALDRQQEFGARILAVLESQQALASRIAESLDTQQSFARSMIEAIESQKQATAAISQTLVAQGELSEQREAADRALQLRSLIREVDDRLKPASDRAITFFARLCGTGPTLIEERQVDELERLSSLSSDPQLRTCAAPVISRMRELLKLGAAAQTGDIDSNYSDAAAVLVDNTARELQNKVKGLITYLRSQDETAPRR